MKIKFVRFLEWCHKNKINLTHDQIIAAGAFFRQSVFLAGRSSGKTFLIDLLKKFDDEDKEKSKCEKIKN